MIKIIPFFSLVNEETVHLKWFEAFMRGRVELEQQTISGLQALLEGAPSPPDSKLLWHCAVEKLLDGTRDELNTRIEELERLKNQLQAVGLSIANAEMCFRELTFEVEKLESTEGVDAAQAATTTLHKYWLDIKSVDVSIQKGLSNLFSSGQAQKAKLEIEKSLQVRKADEALEKYRKQDLTYRRVVHQQRQSQKQFLNSIPVRVQGYGTKYLNAVCYVGMVMDSFANYLRNVSSTCNASGSAIWASAKNIKPLVDANCHTEAIDNTLPIRFTPVHYRNPGSTSLSPSGQTILFGCPLVLHTVGELTKIPPVLEYLLDSVLYWPGCLFDSFKMETYWHLVNELEQAWTGVEESDRAIISNLVSRHNYSDLIMGYFMVLPEPVLSGDDIKVAAGLFYNPRSLILDTWNKDPTKLAVLRALASCRDRLGHLRLFDEDIVNALAQQPVPFTLGTILQPVQIS